MSRARTLAGAIGSDGALNVADVAGLAAVASSGSASDLSTGTLPIARIADGAVVNAKLGTDLDASKLTAGALPIARISDGSIVTAKIADGAITAAKNAMQVRSFLNNSPQVSAFSLGSAEGSLSYSLIKVSSPFGSYSGLAIITYTLLTRLITRGSASSDAFYPFIYKNNTNISAGGSTSVTPDGSRLTHYSGNRRHTTGNPSTPLANGDEWIGMTSTCVTTVSPSDTFSLIVTVDSQSCSWQINNAEITGVLFTGVSTA